MDVPVRKFNVLQHVVRECSFHELNDPPYSPELAPCDFFMLLNHTKHVRGKAFEDEEEHKLAVFKRFEGVLKDFISRDTLMLEDLATQAVGRKGSDVYG